MESKIKNEMCFVLIKFTPKINFTPKEQGRQAGKARQEVR
jgi:hypothetical protein